MQEKKEIQTRYRDAVVRTRKRPASIAAFCGQEGMDTTAVQLLYLTPAEIEQDILLDSFETTLSRLQAAPEYSRYQARERLLAFYYTWIEELTALRDFIKAIDRLEINMIEGPLYLRSLRDPFKQYVSALLADAMESGEVARRVLVGDYYDEALWWQSRIIVNVWLHDDSGDSTRTDAAIEKAVNFAFDLLAPNFFDSGIELVRFFLKK